MFCVNITVDIFFIVTDSWASNDIRFFWHDDGQQGASYVQSLKERPMAQYDLNEFILRAEQLRNFQDGSDESMKRICCYQAMMITKLYKLDFP